MTTTDKIGDKNAHFTHVAGMQLTTTMFWLACGSFFTFAVTAGAFLPSASPVSTPGKVLFSSQSLSFFLLVGFFAFLHAGIKNSYRDHVRSNLWIVCVAAPSFLGAHFIAVFGPLLGIPL